MGNWSNRLISGESLVSTKARVPQNIILSLHMDRLQQLFIHNRRDSIPHAIEGLHIQSRNLHDPTYYRSLKNAKKNIIKTAKKTYPLKPSDLRTQSEAYEERQGYIYYQFYIAMYRELMLLFQRKNVVPAKSLNDAELDLNQLDIG